MGLKVISGGQTGIDQLALKVATEMGIPTGGFCPKNYKTEYGTDIKLKEYGLESTESSNYPPRTELNAKNSDLTILITTNSNGLGSKLTIKCCKKHKKPCLVFENFSEFDDLDLDSYLENFRNMVQNNDNFVINFAGTRGSRITNEQLEVAEKLIVRILNYFCE